MSVLPLQSSIAKTGSFPPISLTIKPLGSDKTFSMNRFLSYDFTSSVLVPVDNFMFSTVMPDDANPITNYVNEGDIVTLQANGQIICTGLIDRLTVEVEKNHGELVIIEGRNLMAQLEDQDAVSLDLLPFYGEKVTPTAVLNKLITDTRIPGYDFTSDAAKLGYLFATEPGESKLAALTRYMEPLNNLAWMNPSGFIVFGRPNMAQPSSGKVFLIKKQRIGNCTSIRAVRNSTQIPNIICPIWTGQESQVARIPKEQIFYNPAQGPARLRNMGHRLPKAVLVDTPEGTSPQELAGVNNLTVAGANLIQAMGKREVARQNIRELEVESVMAGHYNESADPFLIDSVYTVTFDRGGIDGLDMYLHTVNYRLDPENGQHSTLHFCKLGTIVSDIKAP